MATFDKLSTAASILLIIAPSLARSRLILSIDLSRTVSASIDFCLVITLTVDNLLRVAAPGFVVKRPLVVSPFTVNCLLDAIVT